MKFQVWPQYHPAACLHNPRLLADMLEDWSRRPDVVPHDYIVSTWEEFRKYLIE